MFSSRIIIASFCLFSGYVNSQFPVPQWTPTYRMNESTIAMPCNNSGFTDPSSLEAFGLIDFDWSNAKALWAAAKPMNCQELLQEQVEMVKNITPNKRVFIYRNSIKALPWYTSVRLILSDPAYAPWFLNFSSGINGSYHVPPCDNNYNPPLCSDYYHDQSQTPEYPQGDGNCAAPACDVGPVPVGEYLWDPRAANVTVYNQTLLDWLINSYIFDESSAGADGFFFDDNWSTSGPSEFEGHAAIDMGLNKTELIAITEAYYSNMKIIEQTVLDRGKFSWQMLYTDGSTCARPIITNATCASALRSQCTATSPSQTSAMMYAFSPGGCNCQTATLPEFSQDLANFLLIRGDYAWLGHAWCGCSQTYANPPELSVDYGTPMGLCSETQPNSGIFTRQWTKATVQMDCNTWTGTVSMKEDF